jgi:hypothetical protein
MIDLRAEAFRGASVGFAFATVFSSVPPAESRVWSRNPINLASDYLVIQDNRGGGELAIVFWLAPPMIPNPGQAVAAVELLDKYVLIGTVQAHMSKEGTASFEPASTLEAFDESGQSLNALNTASMPPAMVGALTAMQAVFTRSIGALGQGMHFDVFEARNVHACSKGRLTVKFAGEQYTYDTPVPGCP